MKKPKIAIITSVTGGIGYYTASFAKPLQKYADLFFITYKQKDIAGGKTNIITEPFIAQRIKRPKFFIEDNSLYSVDKIINYIKSHNIDLVNVQVATTAKKMVMWYVMLLEILRKNNIPIVFTLHEVLPFENFSGNNDKQFLEVFYSLADYFMLGNEKEKDILIKEFPFVKKEKISTVPHGIYSHFDSKRFNQKTAKNFLEVPQEKDIMLFFGFIRPYKGIIDAIKATKKVLSQCPNALLYIAGSLKFDPDYKKYTQKIEELNLNENIIADFAYMPEERVEALFKACSLVLLPYHRVSQSGNLRLATAFKKPVIVTNIFDEASEIDGQSGFSVPVGNIDKLSQAMAKLLKNKTESEKLGLNGYKIASQKYDWDNTAKKMFNVFAKFSG